MSATTPRVWVLSWENRAYIDGPQPGGARVWLDTPAWFAWLDAATTTRFAYPLFDPAVGYIVAMITVRKEWRARGGAYWTAYRHVGDHLRKIYLGRSATVTQPRLAAIAQALQGQEWDGDTPMSAGGHATQRPDGEKARVDRPVDGRQKRSDDQLLGQEREA